MQFNENQRNKLCLSILFERIKLKQKKKENGKENEMKL